MSRRRVRVALVLSVSVSLLVPTSAGALPGQAGSSPPTDPYIVVLEDSGLLPQVSSLIIDEQAALLGLDVTNVFSHALHGYTAELSADDVAALEADPRVAFVEPDRVYHTQQQDVPTGVQRTFADQNPNLGIGAPAGPDVDVDVAVIDTGVADHPDLNVATSTACELGTCLPIGLGGDMNGHGTHVAGSIGAIDNDLGVVGMAPGARIHSVRVCNPLGSCLTSAIIAGVDHVTSQAGTIEVANMSLGGPGSSEALSQAITRSVDAGVVYAVAAGNDSADAGGFFPASHPDVISVSALADADGQPGGSGGSPACRPESQDDQLADFSNFGEVVDVAAPGVCILSTWNDGGYNTISGTSMASPHAAGAAAILASGAGDPTSRADVESIRQTIVGTGNQGWTDASGDGVQEPLLDVSNASVYDPN